MKYDNGKAPIHLIPPEVLFSVANVLSFGAEKYGPNDWRNDIDNVPMSRNYSSLQRHVLAFWSGEDIDPESGLSHLDHAMCQLIFMIIQHKQGNAAKNDDRFRPEPLEVPDSQDEEELKLAGVDFDPEFLKGFNSPSPYSPYPIERNWVLPTVPTSFGECSGEPVDSEPEPNVPIGTFQWQENDTFQLQESDTVAYSTNNDSRVLPIDGSAKASGIDVGKSVQYYIDSNPYLDNPTMSEAHAILDSITKGN